MRHDIIMPALGMAQDTGLIVSWGKALGDRVSADDVLLEVETDKTTMEIPAGHDGYLAEIHAGAGEDVPVGITIAVITTEEPAETISRRHADAMTARPAENTAQQTPETAGEPIEAVPPRPRSAPAPTPAPAGRILASPKARRLALNEGLDLERLVRAGHTQPFHVSDLAVLRALPEETAKPAHTVSARRLTAMIPASGFDAFGEWFAGETGDTADGAETLAAMAAASLCRAGRENSDLIVRVERFGNTRFYQSPNSSSLEATQIDDASPALIVRDLRHSAISHIALGAGSVPALTLTQMGAELTITFECSPDQLDAGAALTLMHEFAGRMDNPLRHLL